MTTEKKIKRAKEEMLALLKSGKILAYAKKWVDSLPTNPYTGTTYGGRNAVILNAFMLADGIKEGLFGTFKNITDNGGSVKGLSGYPVYAPMGYWVNKKDPKTGKPILGEDGEPEKIWVRSKRVKMFTVFPLEKAGIDLSQWKMETKKNKNVYSIEEIDEFVENFVKLSIGGNQACYSPTEHRIMMPDKSHFQSTEKYYSTLFHELGHSTGQVMKRDMSGSKGSPIYAKEELVAEIFSVYMCKHVGVQYEPSNSAAYIQGWIQAIPEEERADALMDAFSKAEAALKKIVAMQEKAKEVA